MTPRRRARIGRLADDYRQRPEVEQFNQDRAVDYALALGVVFLIVLLGALEVLTLIRP